MMIKQNAQQTIDRWLAEARLYADLDANLRRRRHSRFRCTQDYVIRCGAGCSFPDLEVKGLNISQLGLGVLSRQPIPCAYEVWIHDVEQSPDEPWLTASVIHCTQTLGGYKVGLQLRPEPCRPS